MRDRARVSGVIGDRVEKEREKLASQFATRKDGHVSRVIAHLSAEARDPGSVVAAVTNVQQAMKLCTTGENMELQRWPRLRESHLLAPSGRGARVHATQQGQPYSPSRYTHYILLKPHLPRIRCRGTLALISFQRIMERPNGSP